MASFWARRERPVTPIEGTTPARSGAFAPDRVVHLVAGDDYRVHQLVYAALARDGVRGFLFAPLALTGGVHAVLVRPFDVATRFAEGQEFRMLLRAMPAVKCAGRRRSIGAARAKDALRVRWIDARAQAHGFRLLAPPRLRVERVRLEGARRPFGFNACLYRAPIRVTEAARFARAYARGIGQGRAWGCGMLVLREA